MKLFWFNKSMVHNQTQVYIYDMNNMNQSKVNKRESLEIVDQSQTSRYVSRFEHPALRPRRRRISTIASTQDFLHREPPLRIWANTTLEYTTPLSPNTTFHQRQDTKPKQRKGYTILDDLKDHKPILSHKTMILIDRIDR